MEQVHVLRSYLGECPFVPSHNFHIMDSQRAYATPKRELPMTEATSPSEKLALIGEPPVRMSMADTSTDVKDELRRVKSDMAGMWEHMQEMGRRHNVLVRKVGSSFRQHNELFKDHAQKWETCDRFATKTLNDLAAHHQEFVHCKAEMDAQENENDGDDLIDIAVASFITGSLLPVLITGSFFALHIAFGPHFASRAYKNPRETY